MTVLAVDRDPVALTLTIVSEFDAPAARVWQVWADPRQLERWWGPPTFPATVVDHDLTPGGRVTYYMTGPDAEKYHGWWRVIAVDPPHSLVIEDGFADDSGRPNDDLPTTSIEVRLTAATAVHVRRDDVHFSGYGRSDLGGVDIFKGTADRHEPMPLDVGVPEAPQLFLNPVDSIAVALRSLHSIPELR